MPECELTVFEWKGDVINPVTFIDMMRVAVRCNSELIFDFTGNPHRRGGYDPDIHEVVIGAKNWGEAVDAMSKTKFPEGSDDPDWYNPESPWFGWKDRVEDDLHDVYRATRWDKVCDLSNIK